MIRSARIEKGQITFFFFCINWSWFVRSHTHARRREHVFIILFHNTIFGFDVATGKKYIWQIEKRRKTLLYVECKCRYRLIFRSFEWMCYMHADMQIVRKIRRRRLIDFHLLHWNFTNWELNNMRPCEMEKGKKMAGWNLRTCLLYVAIQNEIVFIVAWSSKENCIVCVLIVGTALTQQSMTEYILKWVWVWVHTHTLGKAQTT